jgi:hypothetical protein
MVFFVTPRAFGARKSLFKFFARCKRAKNLNKLLEARLRAEMGKIATCKWLWHAPLIA